MGRGFSKIKKQAKMLEEQFSKMQEELKTKEVTGEAGGGLVKVTLTGEKKLKSIKINPECVDPNDVEALEDLIFGAFEEAGNKLNDESSMGMPAGLPDMGHLFG